MAVSKCDKVPSRLDQFLKTRPSSAVPRVLSLPVRLAVRACGSIKAKQRVSKAATTERRPDDMTSALSSTPAPRGRRVSSRYHRAMTHGVPLSSPSSLPAFQRSIRASRIPVLDT